jgi:hypothetical protein
MMKKTFITLSFVLLTTLSFSQIPSPITFMPYMAFTYQEIKATDAEMLPLSSSNSPLIWFTHEKQGYEISEAYSYEHGAVVMSQIVTDNYYKCLHYIYWLNNHMDRLSGGTMWSIPIGEELVKVVMIKSEDDENYVFIWYFESVGLIKG